MQRYSKTSQYAQTFTETTNATRCVCKNFYFNQKSNSNKKSVRVMSGKKKVRKLWTVSDR